MIAKVGRVVLTGMMAIVVEPIVVAMIVAVLMAIIKCM
jgi:hypothetical protein